MNSYLAGLYCRVRRLNEEEEAKEAALDDTGLCEEGLVLRCL